MERRLADRSPQGPGFTHEPVYRLLTEAPDVPVNPHVDSPLVLGATRRALARAGLDDLLSPRKENEG